MTDKHTSETLTGGPKQGRGNMKNRTKAGAGGRDSAGLTNRGSSIDNRTHGSTSRAAGLDRARTDVRGDRDDRMNAQVQNTTSPSEDTNPTITHGEGTMESRNTMTSTSSGKDTTTGPGEARRTERSGNIYDPDQPDPHSNPKV